ncbi:hypothetical protein [Lapidilactobacillus gannanensis]|jgi:organic radical activating enzyme|uniref:Uncharacterized protein n=1 Tax=Lapidilactobacillus gannanensis TaxID=2486002 RepID=A0ABW4BNU0_9LACO|nr:hypothetical protein [Lapidilactobacillus gannanensis]MCH4057179.1 hypothetical protein [Lactobacillaceae bacterium]
MIFLNAPIQQQQIIDLLNNYSENGVSFELESKKGMKLVFKTNMDDLEAAAKLAKSVIKAEPWGSVLYFQAGVEK